MKTTSHIRAGLLATLVALVGVALQGAGLALTVTNDKDNAPAAALISGSLRWAIANTPANGTVDFSSGMNGKTILLKGGQLVVDKALTIVGRGTSSLTVSGNNTSRVFYVSGTCTISDLTITKGNGVGLDLSSFGNDSNGGAVHNVGNLQLLRVSVTNNKAQAGSGGGIFNRGTLNALSDSTVSYNTAGQYGGGIYNEQDLTVIRSAITNNSADGDGGGIQLGGTVTLINSTVSSNSTSGAGGGINDPGTIPTLKTYNVTIARNSASRGGGLANVPFLGASWELRNTVVGDNSAATGPDVSSGAFGLPISRGNNLIENTAGTEPGSFIASDIVGMDPRLGPLQNNGGPTLTQALLPGSPAIDKGSNANLLPGMDTDQRGWARIINGGTSPTVDIGAYEYATARGLKNEAIAGLMPCLSSTDCKTRNRAASAILSIQRSLTPSLWAVNSDMTPSDTELSACGELVFEQEEKAAFELQKIIKDSTDAGCVLAATYAVQDLLQADEQLAREAIRLAVVGPGGNAGKIAAANAELVAAQSQIAKQDYKKAIEHFEHAWLKAREALGFKPDENQCKVLKKQWNDAGDGDDDDDCD